MITVVEKDRDKNGKAVINSSMSPSPNEAASFSSPDRAI
jgi:hypothetical protein